MYLPPGAFQNDPVRGRPPAGYVQAWNRIRHAGSRVAPMARRAGKFGLIGAGVTALGVGAFTTGAYLERHGR